MVETREAGRTGTARTRRVIETVTELVQPILASVGAELDRIELTGGRTPNLRVFIDKAGGVDVEDCAEVSRQLSPLLDDDDVIRGPFVLEVSSPGLTRPLHGEQDFQRFTGRLAVVHAKEPIVGRRREVTGRLAGVEAGAVLVAVEGEDEPVRVPLGSVTKARLEIEV